MAAIVPFGYMRLPTTVYLILFIALLLGTIHVYREIFAAPVLIIEVLDVAQGRAVLVKTPRGDTYLIDAGRDASVLRALGRALPLWKRRLDGVILTNAVPDLAGGLPDVLRRYKTPTLIRSSAEGSWTQESNIESATKNVAVLAAARGDRIELGSNVYIDVLWPPKGGEFKTADGALTLLLSYGSTSVFIDSELPPRIQTWLALPTVSLIISSSTSGTFVFDGNAVR